MPLHFLYILSIKMNINLKISLQFIFSSLIVSTNIKDTRNTIKTYLKELFPL